MYSSYSIKKANSSRGSIESTFSLLNNFNNNKCQSKNVYDNSLLTNDDSDSTLHTINTQMNHDMFNQSEISNINVSSILNKNTKDKEECNKRCVIYNNNNN
jgi:hypothetical protein